MKKIILIYDMFHGGQLKLLQYLSSLKEDKLLISYEQRAENVWVDNE